MQRIRDCLFADDVLYDTESWAWVKEVGDLVVVGVDTVRAWLSGPLTSVYFKEPGTKVERGMSIGATEGSRHFDTVRSPISGTVVEYNRALKDTPRLMNTDPYGSGWFVKIRPANLAEEKGRLMSLDSARDAIGNRIAELKVRCFAEFPDYEMFEIGTECSAVLAKLDEVLARAPEGSVVHLVSDDATAEVELTAWSERTHHQILESRKEGNLTHFIVK